GKIKISRRPPSGLSPAGRSAGQQYLYPRPPPKLALDGERAAVKDAAIVLRSDSIALNGGDEVLESAFTERLRDQLKRLENSSV
ncbi:MAG: hypothetical protein ACYC0C_13375, partial [Devosia sp.]